MKVLVLGCGPAGLMAAHAAAIMKHEVGILSKKRKSYMRGAQYLHAPIPLPDGRPMSDEFEIDYQLRGEVSQYRTKVYGPLSREQVSPEDLVGKHRAWDIRVAYDWLWEKYADLVTDAGFNNATDVDEAIQWAKADVVISTIPATHLCMEGHTFTQSWIWSTDQPMEIIKDNTVVCNGEDAPRWYRAAKIQGWDTVEWPQDSRPPLSGDHLWQVPKPLSTNCNCFPDVHRMGRYGKWTKGVLSHEAFYDTLTVLSQPIQEGMF